MATPGPPLSLKPSSIDLVLLDRDGVINRDSEAYIRTPDEWHAIDGAMQAIAALQARFQVAVCTNQSGIGRGFFSTATLQAIHSKLNDAARHAGGRDLDVFFCPHLPEDECACRKPQAGLLTTAMQARGVGPARTIYVGDSEKDLLAAKAAGCRAVLVRTGNGTRTAETDAAREAVVFDDLAALGRALAKRRG